MSETHNPFRTETPYDLDVAQTDGIVVIDGRLVEIRAGDPLPYPFARVMPASKPRPRYRRHPRG